MPTSRAQVYGLEPILLCPALLAASADALIVPVARFTTLLSDNVVRGATLGSAAMLALIFLRALVDPTYHRAVAEANRQMQGDPPRVFRWIPWLDPDWGLFGAFFGGGYLAPLRAVLLAEFLLALITSGFERSGPALWLAAVAAGIAVMISLTQLKDHFPP